jgi:cytochrome P450
MAMMEMLRAYAAVSVNRICANEIEFGGVKMKPGDKILLPTPLAGRDPEQYDQPNEIRFDRGATNITFGFGIHQCLGLYLAQREMLFALKEMLSSIPQFRLADGFQVPFRVGSIMQVASLELTWN